MATPREYPYIWATWLPRLLTGENSCEWAVWFKAHHQNWTRTPSEFNQAQWMLNHTALLNRRRADWEVAATESKSRDRTASSYAANQQRCRASPT